jgi:UDP-N-acetylglucosamine acyltransferase
MSIHPTAVIDVDAELDDDVTVGPYCIVGPAVTLGRGTVLEAHVHVHGYTAVGENCRFSSFGSIGSLPQDLKYRGEPSYLRIGNANVFREFVTVNRGTEGGGGTTSIGNGNFFMAYAHVAHDSHVGNHVIMATAATLAGHVMVGDHSTVGAFSAVHQFCRVGPHAFIGGFSVVTRDALPYIKTVGDRNQARIYGINAIGLERKGISKEIIDELKRAYRILFRSDLNTSDALRRARAETWVSAEAKLLFEFIETAERGFVR